MGEMVIPSPFQAQAGVKRTTDDQGLQGGVMPLVSGARNQWAVRTQPLTLLLGLQRTTAWSEFRLSYLLLRFRTDDENTQDSTNPIPIVTGQTKRSYYRHVYLYCSAAPGTKVDNIKIYTDGGGFGTGVTVYSGDETPTKNSGSSAGYDLATGTPGDTGDELVASHQDITAKSDFFGYTSPGSEKSVSISEVGNIIDAIGETSDYVVLQMDVADTASPGTLTAETFTWQYDEI